MNSIENIQKTADGMGTIRSMNAEFQGAVTLAAELAPQTLERVRQS